MTPSISLLAVKQFCLLARKPKNREVSLVCSREMRASIRKERPGYTFGEISRSTGVEVSCRLCKYFRSNFQIFTHEFNAGNA